MSRVVVAMSGGVDSSVAALLLVEAGYSIIGATMLLHDNNEHQAVDDARLVCEYLGIPHILIDVRRKFEDTVISDFICEYECGRTPNPCILCNRAIKFGTMLDIALETGAQSIATGHYAQVRWDSSQERYMLIRSIDLSKDQSYVLYTLNQSQLSRIIFPLGLLTKTKVRELAVEHSLPVAHRPESQEICFIPSDDYRSFIKMHAPQTAIPGAILDSSGARLGTHQGIGSYTIGQRRGLGSAIPPNLYVKSIRSARNEVVVGPIESLYADRLVAERVNLIASPTVCAGMRVSAKVRYTAPLVPAMLYPLNSNAESVSLEVRFIEPVRAITPGQAVVFYDGDIVVGGGTISG